MVPEKWNSVWLSRTPLTLDGSDDVLLRRIAAYRRGKRVTVVRRLRVLRRQAREFDALLVALVNDVSQLVQVDVA